MKCNNMPKPNTITQLLVTLMFASVFGADSAFGQTAHNDNASRLPKAENKVADTESVRHLLHQAQSLAPLASTTQATVIIGPKVGYEGAKYSLQSAQEGDVTWSSNNPDVASINASGILTVKGRGVVVLTANYKNQRYNQTILVGIPRFILLSSPQKGGYKVVAKCIDSEYKNYHGVGKKKDLYETARVFLRCKDNLPDKYKDLEWMPFTAIVLSPLKGRKEIDVKDGGPLVGDIMTEEEYEHIKSHSSDNQTYTYTLLLLNFSQKVIQFIPVSFTFKTSM